MALHTHNLGVAGVAAPAISTTGFQEDLATELLRQFEQKRADRGNFEGLWQEISERMLPDHSGSFTANSIQTPGERRTELLFDSTAQISLGRFVAIVDSILTPRNSTWHRLLADDRILARNRQAKLWFEEVNRILFKQRYAPAANFASQNLQVWESLGAYGTGAMFIDDLVSQNGVQKGLRYKNITLATLYFRENHQGIVDTVFRPFILTARQIWQLGQSNRRNPWFVPATVIAELSKNPDREFKIVHCVKPREAFDPGRKDPRGLPIASYYISEDERVILNESGYATFPYSVTRYRQTNGEVYGRSPGMDILPALKTLNEEKKTMLKQGHRTVDPVLLAHDDGVLDSFSMRPGSLNYGGVNKDGRALIHTLPVGNIVAGKDLMNDEQETIKDAFFVNIFQILVDNPQMTAAEVLERAKEKGILLAPTIGRQQADYLGPTIDRELDILSRQGELPPQPPILAQAAGEYRLEYDSPLSRTQRAEEAGGALRTIEAAINVAAQTGNAEPLDHFNWDVIVPETADINGMPASWRNSAEKIAQIREGRAAQQQLQEAATIAPGAAALTNAVNKTA